MPVDNGKLEQFCEKSKNKNPQSAAAIQAEYHGKRNSKAGHTNTHIVYS